MALDGNRGRTWQSLGLPTPLCGLLRPNESLASHLDGEEGVALCCVCCWCCPCVVGVVELKTL
jgi:hypothetical protein